MGKTKYPGKPGRDTAFWRGDYTDFWALVIVFTILTVALAVLLHFRPAFYGWIAIGAGLIGIWVAILLILVPRSARTSRDMEHGRGLENDGQ